MNRSSNIKNVFVFAGLFIFILFLLLLFTSNYDNSNFKSENSQSLIKEVNFTNSDYPNVDIANTTNKDLGINNYNNHTFESSVLPSNDNSSENSNNDGEKHKDNNQEVVDYGWLPDLAPTNYKNSNEVLFDDEPTTIYYSVDQLQKTLYLSNNDQEGTFSSFKTDGNCPPWFEYNKVITKVNIIDEIFPSNTSYFLSPVYKTGKGNLSNITTIEGLSNLNMSKVINADFTFAGLKKLDTESIKFSDSLNLNECSSAYCMFQHSSFSKEVYCGFAYSITNKLANSSFMFADCINLNLDRSINLSGLQDANGMFANDTGLTSFWLYEGIAPIKACNMICFLYGSNVESIEITWTPVENSHLDRMFDTCKKLSRIYVPDNINWSKVKNISGQKIFQNCDNLNSILTKFDKDNIDINLAKYDDGKADSGYFTKSLKIKDKQYFPVFNDGELTNVVTFYFSNGDVCKPADIDKGLVMNDLKRNAASGGIEYAAYYTGQAQFTSIRSEHYFKFDDVYSETGEELSSVAFHHIKTGPGSIGERLVDSNDHVVFWEDGVFSGSQKEPTIAETGVGINYATNVYHVGEGDYGYFWSCVFDNGDAFAWSTDDSKWLSFDLYIGETNSCIIYRNFNMLPLRKSLTVNQKTYLPVFDDGEAPFEVDFYFADGIKCSPSNPDVGLRMCDLKRKDQSGNLEFAAYYSGVANFTAARVITTDWMNAFGNVAQVEVPVNPTDEFIKNQLNSDGQDKLSFWKPEMGKVPIIENSKVTFDSFYNEYYAGDLNFSNYFWTNYAASAHPDRAYVWVCGNNLNTSSVDVENNILVSRLFDDKNSLVVDNNLYHPVFKDRCAPVGVNFYFENGDKCTPVDPSIGLTMKDLCRSKSTGEIEYATKYAGTTKFIASRSINTVWDDAFVEPESGEYPKIADTLKKGNQSISQKLSYGDNVCFWNDVLSKEGYVCPQIVDTGVLLSEYHNAYFFDTVRYYWSCVANDKDNAFSWRSNENNWKVMERIDNFDVIAYQYFNGNRYQINFNGDDGIEKFTDINGQEIKNNISVSEGWTYKFKIVLTEGYSNPVVKDGDTIIKPDDDGVYTIDHLRGNHNINVTTSLPIYQITLSKGESVAKFTNEQDDEIESPIKIEKGSSFKFKVVLNRKYSHPEVYVDNKDKLIPSEDTNVYTILNIVTNHEISVKAIIEYKNLVINNCQYFPVFNKDSIPADVDFYFENGDQCKPSETHEYLQMSDLVRTNPKTGQKEYAIKYTGSNEFIAMRSIPILWDNTFVEHNKAVPTYPYISDGLKIGEDDKLVRKQLNYGDNVCFWKDAFVWGSNAPKIPGTDVVITNVVNSYKYRDNLMFWSSVAVNPKEALVWISDTWLYGERSDSSLNTVDLPIYRSFNAHDIPSFSINLNKNDVVKSFTDVEGKELESPCSVDATKDFKFKVVLKDVYTKPIVYDSEKLLEPDEDNVYTISNVVFNHAVYVDAGKCIGNSLTIDNNRYYPIFNRGDAPADVNFYFENGDICIPAEPQYGLQMTDLRRATPSGGVEYATQYLGSGKFYAARGINMVWNDIFEMPNKSNEYKFATKLKTGPGSISEKLITDDRVTFINKGAPPSILNAGESPIMPETGIYVYPCMQAYPLNTSFSGTSVWTCILTSANTAFSVSGANWTERPINETIPIALVFRTFNEKKF